MQWPQWGAAVPKTCCKNGWETPHSPSPGSWDIQRFLRRPHSWHPAHSKSGLGRCCFNAPRLSSCCVVPLWGVLPLHRQWRAWQSPGPPAQPAGEAAAVDGFSSFFLSPFYKKSHDAVMTSQNGKPRQPSAPLGRQSEGSYPTARLPRRTGPL